ncbi:lipocalin family protein [uncultured Microscilla sp.]|uniref:lipocalin family protein n=1 Tax=uncultured Microscilla sp. TaxID=432653 RepID=UPI0026051824|nr:lipocalin family protein [uncultured Microscilla sp.]
MSYFYKIEMICMLALVGWLQSCAGGSEQERTTVVGEWKISHQAQVEAMSAEERQFYDNLSDDKKEEIREATQIEYYFHADGRFEKIHKNRTDTGKWQLSADRKLLTITYDDGKALKLVVKKLTNEQLRVGTDYGMRRTDIVLEPY